MNTPYRWISFAALASTFVLITSDAQAFTDANAELKDAAVQRSARATAVAAKAAPPVRTAWVPTTAKKLDGFKPVLPPERDNTEKLAKAEMPAAPAKR